ncbi:MAG: hypothetical protein Q8P20_00220 [bacterium]|nr:hypothetical protein [bacterium]
MTNSELIILDNIKILSFTGTRKGMTLSQIESFKSILDNFKNNFKEIILIHGDCIGADEDAHAIANNMNLKIRKRPCNIISFRAFTEEGNIIADPEDPIIRNHKMVDESDELIACPAGEEEIRSGTWSTIRCAKKLQKKLTIIWPSGQID